MMTFFSSTRLRMMCNSLLSKFFVLCSLSCCSYSNPHNAHVHMYTHYFQCTLVMQARTTHAARRRVQLRVLLYFPSRSSLCADIEMLRCNDVTPLLCI
mmetsp:Transcript_47048/g.121559  ORF Transcript_47048/g.121559 Transcript_47048/m.121559 type:complete len:98 (-) Transcript_47048:1810-2103(-)